MRVEAIIIMMAALVITPVWGSDCNLVTIAEGEDTD